MVHRWVTISNILADSGADISVLPHHLGAYLVGDVRQGTPQTIRGIVPGAQTHIYIHHVWCRWDEQRFRMPVAIAEHDDVPLIFGRTGALDRFVVTFYRGRETRLKP